MAVLFIFIWASMTVVKAINTAVIPPVEFLSDIVSINLKGLKEIEPRLGFNVEFLENNSGNTSQKNEFCSQVITSAVSPEGECREFSTPCDVSAGWRLSDKCLIKSDLEIMGNTE